MNGPGDPSSQTLPSPGVQGSLEVSGPSAVPVPQISQDSQISQGSQISQDPQILPSDSPPYPHPAVPQPQRSAVDTALWRALGFFRSLALLYAVARFATSYSHYAHRGAAIAVLFTMAVWTAWTGIVYHRTTTPRRALLAFLAADFAVGAAAVLSTELVDTQLADPGRRPDAADRLVLGAGDRDRHRAGLARRGGGGRSDGRRRPPRARRAEPGLDPQHRLDGPDRRGHRLRHRARPHRRAHPGPGPAAGGRHPRAPAAGPRHPRRRAAGAGPGPAARRGDRRRGPRPGPDGRGAGSRAALAGAQLARGRGRHRGRPGGPGPERPARPAGRAPGDAGRSRHAGDAARPGGARGGRGGRRRAGQRPAARRPRDRRPRGPRVDPGRGRGRRGRRDSPRRRPRHPRGPAGGGARRRPARRRALHPGPAAATSAGSVDVVSVPGQGTEVEMRVPRLPVPRGAAPSVSAIRKALR